MPKNSMFLPVGMVLVIVLCIGVVMLSGRTNDPGIVGDQAYPHQICTFNRYCDGDTCYDRPLPVIAYFEHENGEPRLEIPGMSPQATLVETDDRFVFTSTGGTVAGSLTIFRNRNLDFVATEGEGASVIEHYASGRCDRPQTP